MMFIGDLRIWTRRFLLGRSFLLMIRCIVLPLVSFSQVHDFVVQWVCRLDVEL